MEILLKFKYDNIYYYVIRDNNKILYYYISENEKSFNLNELQIKLIEKVIRKLAPSTERIKVMDYLLNGNNYEVSIDKKTHFHFFNPLPNDNDLYKLNMIFNNMNECLFSENGFNNQTENMKDKLIKRIIKIGNKTIITFVSISLIFQASYLLNNEIINRYNDYLSQKTEIIAVNDKDLSNQETIDIDETIVDNNDALITKFEQIMEQNKKITDQEVIRIVTEAVNCNPNLSLEEKNKILSYMPLFIDNKAYMDFNFIKSKFSTLEIIYEKNPGPYGGAYYPTENKICIWNSRDFNDASPDIFSHELFHVTQNYPSDYNWNHFLVETTNTIFCIEYANQNDNNLDTQMYDYTRILMEIIGSEPLKKFHNYPVTSIVTDALKEVIDDENKAIKLLENLNNYRIIYEDNSSVREQNLERIKEEIYLQLSEYYYAKYGISITIIKSHQHTPYLVVYHSYFNCSAQIAY